MAGNVGVAIAFGAGLASFLSPCVLPLIPSYITFITGMTLDDVQRAR
ncbi:MAG: cytochrome c biogenesis protein CcdA, partial [Gemmatimonas sp.]